MSQSSQALDRAMLLIDQGRHELAEPELRQALAQDPDHAGAHAMLAICLMQVDRLEEATASAQEAISRGPDLPFMHYVLALVLRARDRTGESFAAIREAIRLDSADAEYFWVLGALHSDEQQWQEALDAAEEGLRADPEHVACTNLRALALVKLGRRAEAGQVLDAALAREPENAMTHANRGWALLHESKPHEALDCFREALRLEPMSEWARQGVVEALKARNPVYGLFLRYFLWMGRLGERMQWGVILGGFIGYRILGAIAEAQPAAAPFVKPLQVLYVVFVVLTWTAQPLFNLLLRLNRAGRLALSPEQITASNWIGSVVALALAALVGCLVRGFKGPPLAGLLVFAGLVIPMAARFSCRAVWAGRMMTVYVSVLAAAGLVLIADSFVAADAQGGLRVLRGFGAIAFPVFLVGVMAAPWVGNLLASRRDRR